jgi:hypothetical protein
MSSLFTNDMSPQSFLGLVRAREQEMARTRKLKPLHILINAGLAALLFGIAVMGFASMNEARNGDGRLDMPPKQINDQVVVCSLDTCRLPATLDA